MNNEVIFSSKSAEWETPQWLFDKYNDIYHFDLDVCASDTNHKCINYFTKEQDGLMQNWAGHTCWMNPPYGREIIHWISKAWATIAIRDPHTIVVALLPARTDTKWFHQFIYKLTPYTEIEFLKGRLKFGGYIGKNAAPFPSMIVKFESMKRKSYPYV